MFKIHYTLPSGQTGLVHVRGEVSALDATLTARGQVGSAALLGEPVLMAAPTALRRTRGSQARSLLKSSINSCLPYESGGGAKASVMSYD